MTEDGKANYAGAVAQRFVMVRKRATGRSVFFRRHSLKSPRFPRPLYTKIGESLHAETHGGIRCEWLRITGGAGTVCARADGHGYQIVIAAPDDGGAFMTVVNENGESAFVANL